MNIQNKLESLGVYAKYSEDRNNIDFIDLNNKEKKLSFNSTELLSLKEDEILTKVKTCLS